MDGEEVEERERERREILRGDNFILFSVCFVLSLVFPVSIRSLDLGENR